MYTIPARFLLILLLASPLLLRGQTVTWPSPEVEQMYNQARQQHSSGNFRAAMTLYQQAIQIAPEIMVLHRELGKTYYLAGAHEEAVKTLKPIVESGDADEQTYQSLMASYFAMQEFKKARATFEQGIARFPHSGLIYHQMGKIYEDDRNDEKALETWLNGIEADPGYHVNYYDAARMYMYTNKPLWAILYAEMFINIEQHTPRANDARGMLLKAYDRLYKSIATGEIPKYGKKTEATTARAGFEEAVFNTYKKLSPVISDGLNTESLTMLRTRFMMDWQQRHNMRRYPFTLFTRQDDMIRTGYFDIYNQWLFGKAENMAQYEAWVKFHPAAMGELAEYLKEKPFYPTAGDAYNDKDLKGIFIKKDNKR